jgi:hypothetical protein
MPYVQALVAWAVFHHLLWQIELRPIRHNFNVQKTPIWINQNPVEFVVRQHEYVPVPWF